MLVIKVTPGEFPPALLEQDEFWVMPDGDVLRLRELESGQAQFAMDYLMSHARALRNEWAMEKLDLYDPEQKARRWILETPLCIGVMCQLVILAQAAIEEEVLAKLEPVLSDGAILAIEDALDRAFIDGEPHDYPKGLLEST